LSEYDLNLNDNTMRFRFNEQVVKSTFAPSKVTLQFSETDKSKFHTLSNDGVTNDGSNNRELVVSLDDADVIALKENLDLCKDKPTTWLSMGAGVVQDVAENEAVAIVSGSAKQVEDYTQDGKGPVLQSYTLNMQTGLMSLTFDEIMAINTLTAGAALLQSVQVADTTEETSDALEGSVASGSSNAKVVNIQLTLTSANKIRAKTGLAIDGDTAYLTFDSTFIKDVDNNGVDAIATSGGQKVATNGLTLDGEAPSMASFKLDLSTDPATLTMVFDQPVKASSFTDGTLQLQDASSVTDKVDISGATANAAVTTDVVLTLAVANVNAIKASGFCTKTGDGGDCFLSHTDAMIDDARDLQVAATDDTNGVSCSDYTADGTAPTIEDAQIKKFDLNTGKITLSFSEIIDRSSFEKAKFHFKSDSNDNDASSFRELTGGTVADASGNAEDATELVITLSGDDLDYVKLQEELCTRRSSCYLKLLAGGFKDHAGNLLEASPTDNHFQTRSNGGFVDDNIKPTVAGWSIDIDESEVSFTFSEPVDFESISRSAITLMNAQSGSKTVTLDSCEDNVACATNPSGRVVTFVITSDDLNTIKKEQFCISTATCYVSFTDTLVEDTARAANAIAAVTAAGAIVLPDNQHSPDVTGPKLGSFSFDLEQGQVYLTFNEPVKPGSLNPTKITLQSTETSDDVKLVLHSTSAVDEDVAGIEASLTLTVTMIATDVVALKENAALFTAQASSFLSMEVGAVADMVDRDVEAVASTSAKKATSHIDDSSPGKLTSFVLDLNDRELRLTFDEVMDVSTFKAKHLTIQPVAEMEGTTGKEAVTLSDSAVKANSADSAILIISLSLTDQIELGNNVNLATKTDKSDTFITMSAACIDDVVQGRDVIAISDGNGLAATAVVLDTTDPKIESSTLNLEAETLTIVFDEPMQKTGFTGTALSLQATGTGGASQTLESTVFAVTENGQQDTFVLTLVPADLDAIKLAETLGVVDANDNSLVTTYVVTGTGLHSDFNGRSVTAIGSGAAKAVNTLTPDDTDPELESFEINMDSAQLKLTFNEPILASSLTIDQGDFTIQDAATASTTHPLSGGSKGTVNGRVMTITISVDDLNAIKGKAMGTSDSDTFIVMTANAAKDMTLNEVKNLDDGSGMQCKLNGYTGDDSRPTIDSFTFDLNLGKIILAFSETASANSVTLPQQFTIQSHADLSSVGAKSRALSAGTKSSTDSTSITITLDEDDLNFIKADTGLASTAATTFLAYTEDAAKDVSGNKVVAGVHQVKADGSGGFLFTKDTTDPELDDFSIDMNTGTVSLTFSESVDTNTFDETAITLQSAQDGTAGTTKKLSPLSTAKSKIIVDSRTLSFVMADADLDVVKYSAGFATEDSNVFISFSAGMIQDMADTNARSVAAILVGDAKVSKVGSFVADATAPAVDSFTFDLDDGKLVMAMSEPMGTVFDVTKLKLVSSSSANAAYHTPSTATTVARSGATGKTLTVSFSADDLDFIKALPLLAVSKASTILTITSAFAKDTTGIAVAALANSDNTTPVEANGSDGYSADESNPSLTGFVLDLRTNTLRLTFDETVKAGQVDLSGIKLLASQGATAADEIYQLSTSANSNNVQCAT